MLRVHVNQKLSSLKQICSSFFPCFTPPWPEVFSEFSSSFLSVDSSSIVDTCCPSAINKMGWRTHGSLVQHQRPPSIVNRGFGNTRAVPQNTRPRLWSAGQETFRRGDTLTRVTGSLAKESIRDKYERRARALADLVETKTSVLPRLRRCADS